MATRENKRLHNYPPELILVCRIKSIVQVRSFIPLSNKFSSVIDENTLKEQKLVENPSPQISLP